MYESFPNNSLVVIETIFSLGNANYFALKSENSMKPTIMCLNTSTYSTHNLEKCLYDDCVIAHAQMCK